MLLRLCVYCCTLPWKSLPFLSKPCCPRLHLDSPASHSLCRIFPHLSLSCERLQYVQHPLYHTHSCCGILFHRLVWETPSKSEVQCKPMRSSSHTQHDNCVEESHCSEHCPGSWDSPSLSFPFSGSFCARCQLSLEYLKVIIIQSWCYCFPFIIRRRIR